MIGGHFLREASSLRNQQTDALDEVGLRLVLCGLFPSGQNFPIPTFSNPVLLALAQCFSFHLLKMVSVTLFGLAECFVTTPASCERVNLFFKFAELRIAVYVLFEV